MSQNKTTRREFVRNGLAAGALATGSAVGAPLIVGQDARGANERIGIGFIGTGGRCGAHIQIINKLKEQGLASPVAVCDVYRPRLEAAGKATGGAKMYDEHEAMLADSSVDVAASPRPASRAADDRRARGGQGRLLRETADPLGAVRAGQEDRRDGQEDQAARPGRHPAHGRR